MSRFIAPLALALSLALTGVASAQPMYGNALAEAAQAGSLTPHGVFDGK